jgi:MFS family permease
VRKTFTGLGLALSTIILPVALVRGESLAMALLMVACLCYGMFASNVWAITQTLAGPHGSGKWTAAQNGFGNFSGFVGPIVTGWLVDRTGLFSLSFAVAAAVALAGSAIFVFGIGPIKEIHWDEVPTPKYVRHSGFSLIGSMAGGAFGYFLGASPSVSFGDVLTRGALLDGVHVVFRPAAVAASNYMLAGAVAGMVGGLGLAYFISTRETSPDAAR